MKTPQSTATKKPDPKYTTVAERRAYNDGARTARRRIRDVVTHRLKNWRLNPAPDSPWTATYAEEVRNRRDELLRLLKTVQTMPIRYRQRDGGLGKDGRARGGR